MHSLFLSLPASADRDPQAASRAQSPLGIAIVAFIAYYAGAKLGLALTTQPNPMSILWPPNAILFAMLLIVPARRWWVVLAAITPAHFLAELQVGVPGPMVVLWLVSNVSEALIGALCMRKLVPGPIAFAQLRDVLAFMFSAALASRSTTRARTPAAGACLSRPAPSSTAAPVPAAR